MVTFFIFVSEIFFMNKILLSLFVIVLCSCADEVKPKPKGQLSLDYKQAKYELFDSQCAYTFQKNSIAVSKNSGNCSYEFHYPKMKATLYINYKSVNNNLEMLLLDAQKLTYDHVVKANDITEQPYINEKNKVYGMFYQVGGNAATNAQFYLTDSTKNFLVGSLYFYAKPNFDSILPAADYIKNDMKKIVESIHWK